ncbi:lathosterol oxidase-like [Sitodiplosis mosellana]|uniref:lathosterol oxidase-like n=1 Tax=Sitodiplosis mosellana TaxID=263140 RepID=UPI00244442F7|nr:lathosterol oxidase-like [Sitodiplosis mosellana]
MTFSNGKTVEQKDLTIGEKVKNGYNPMMEGVRWSERSFFASRIEQIWKYIPNWLGQIFVTIAIFLFASGIQGDWITIIVHYFKHIEQSNSQNEKLITAHAWPDDKNGSLLFFIIVSAISSYGLYFVIGGFLHWYFYVRQRDKSHEWKCQPEIFMSPELERHEMLFGSLSLGVVSFLTGCISWYAANDGKYLKIYYRADEYGWLWFFLQIPIVFMYQDYLTYWIHRFYHYPFLYKHFHKLHHKYKQPTAFSVSAIHPVEIVNVQMALASPMVLVPVHWILFYGILIYTYYHGIIDHSGIAFKAQWWQPWQPDAIFHDNHHQYFHVNYGFNIWIWDKLHGTYRRKNRVYREDIFYGKGKAFDEVSSEILANDLAERKSENPLAYRGNYNENDLTEDDLKTK